METFIEIIRWLTFRKEFRKFDYIALAIFIWLAAAALAYCFFIITDYLKHH